MFIFRFELVVFGRVVEGRLFLQKIHGSVEFMAFHNGR